MLIFFSKEMDGWVYVGGVELHLATLNYWQ